MRFASLVVQDSLRSIAMVKLSEWVVLRIYFCGDGILTKGSATSGPDLAAIDVEPTVDHNGCDRYFSGRELIDRTEKSQPCQKQRNQLDGRVSGVIHSSRYRIESIERAVAKR